MTTRVDISLHLTPVQVKRLIGLARERVTCPEQLTPLDKRQLCRIGVRELVRMMDDRQRRAGK